MISVLDLFQNEFISPPFIALRPLTWNQGEISFPRRQNCPGMSSFRFSIRMKSSLWNNIILVPSELN